MKRVVITGMGAVSSLGANLDEIRDSLREGRSGIRFIPEYKELGFRSQVGGVPPVEPAQRIDRKLLRFMGDAAAYTYLAMEEAMANAGLDADQISDPRIGLITGSGGSSTANMLAATDALRAKGVRRVGPYMVTRTMASTTSACVGTAFKIKGTCYSISSACATSAHCIGTAMEQIQLGKQDMVFAGGGEELHWTMSVLFDAMGALASNHNDAPEQACRPYDRDRDGFVIAGGGGMVVVEELEHALARGANILAEIVGYGATSDGYDMVQPSGEGAVRCMRMALEGVTGPIDYINAHGTGTPVGDGRELEAIRAVFGDQIPPIASTKSLSGHSLGAAGVQEAIYSLLMMRDGFISASANIDHLDEAAEGMPVVTALREGVQLQRVLSNSFGFGGANASLVLARYSQ